MRIPLKRLFAAILPLTGLLLTAPFATTAQAAHDPGWWYRHSHHDYYRRRQWRGYSPAPSYSPPPYWRGYSYRDPYYYPRRWRAPERYSYYRPDPYWYSHRRHHHDD